MRPNQESPRPCRGELSRIDCQVGEDGIAVVSLGSSSETILAQALDVQRDAQGQPVVVLLDRLIVNPARYDTYRGWQPNGCYVTRLAREAPPFRAGRQSAAV